MHDIDAERDACRQALRFAPHHRARPTRSLAVHDMMAGRRKEATDHRCTDSFQMERNACDRATDRSEAAGDSDVHGGCAECAVTTGQEVR